VSLKNSVTAFLEGLAGFSYSLSCRDHVWQVIFPDRTGKWRHLHVMKYERTFFVNHVDGELGTLLLEPRGNLQATDSLGNARPRAGDDGDTLVARWGPVLAAARAWLKAAGKDWIGAGRRVRAGYPLNHRYGVVPHALVRASLPGIHRLDEELGAAKTRKLVRLVEEGVFSREASTVAATMTAADYFRYCKIAYVAGKRRDETVDASLSGRELYERHADGRNEGLLDIDATSPQEFADWIDGTHPKRSTGGHPWEIKRGGNTTHIDLSVRRPSHGRKEGFLVELQGESIGRMAETMKMLLAIHDASLPISIDDPEGVRKRLLAQDNIGIVPAYHTLHRANQHFEKNQDVYDVMHYDELGRFKRRIAPFVTWEPLPLLRPEARGGARTRN